MNSRIYDVVVIGGGPAGMMAAGTAGKHGRSVLVLEKNEKLGKKLLISGGGRCNITNNKQEVRTMLERYKESGKFLFSAFAQFSVKDSITFFEGRGVPLKEENDGRMFPVSNSAKTVLNTLVAYMKEGKVEVRTRCNVVSIAREGEMFVVTLKSGEVVHARTCVLSTGGTSHPETGSTGDGFRFAKELGHTVIENNFALVPIALSDAWARTLGGVVLPDIRLTVLSDGKKQSTHAGKLLFTHFGVSGPTVLNVSREVGELLQHSSVQLSIDMFPKQDTGTLRATFQKLLSEESNKKLKNTLHALMPAALVEPLLVLAQVDGDTPNHSIRSEERARLLALFKAVPLNVKGLLGADKAIISAGGVALEEIDFKTMQSRLVKGLYLVGDVMNVDRPSGGYSLQLCWTQGYVAGMNA